MYTSVREKNDSARWPNFTHGERLKNTSYRAIPCRVRRDHTVPIAGRHHFSIHDAREVDGELTRHFRALEADFELVE